MYVAVRKPNVDFSNAMRWCARASGTFLMLCWVTLFIKEITRQGLGEPEFNTYGQAAALAVVFAGYVIGWWKEFAGGALASAGMFAYVLIVAAASQRPAEPATLWFAAPGILYLLAHQFNEHRVNV